MPGYFGSEQQMRLQRVSDENAVWAATTPGACLGGRMLTADDFDRLGLMTIGGHLAAHGAFAFRMVPETRVAALEEWLASDGYRIDWWDAFLARRSEAITHIERQLNAGLPAGLEAVDLGDDPAGPPMRRLQAFLVENGLVPFSGSMLLGHVVPSATIALARANGALAAVGYTYLPHNAYSPWHDAAFVGLIAVAPTERGLGLGRLINSMLVQAAFDRLGAGRVYEMAHATNLSSRRMIEASGLTHNPDVRGGIAMAGEARFTA